MHSSHDHTYMKYQFNMIWTSCHWGPLKSQIFTVPFHITLLTDKWSHSVNCLMCHVAIRFSITTNLLSLSLDFTYERFLSIQVKTDTILSSFVILFCTISCTRGIKKLGRLLQCALFLVKTGVLRLVTKLSQQ